MNHRRYRRRASILIFALGAVFFIAFMFSLTACGGTCKGLVTLKSANSDGTVTLKIHKGNGSFCYETDSALKFANCDAGGNYPRCAGE